MHFAGIVRSQEYKDIYASNRRMAASDLVMLYQPSPQPGLFLGITVSKKVGKAVVRNKIKRRIKNFFYTVTGQCPGIRAVIIARPSAARAGYTSLAGQLANMLAKLGC